MNINKNLLLDLEETKKIIPPITTHNMVFNTMDRNLEDETLWKFRVKLGTNSERNVKYAIYENDKRNINGVSVDGQNYKPYNPLYPHGNIIKFDDQKFNAENGISIQKNSYV